MPKELKQYEKLINTQIKDKNMNPLWHIGKRSAAGRYCEDCGTTFCIHGTSRIHYEDNPYQFLTQEWENTQKYYWYEKCPICGKEGISICSFTWTFMKQKQLIEQLSLNPNTLSKKLIVNEYEEEFTPTEFLWNELNNCKVEYQSCCEFC